MINNKEINELIKSYNLNYKNFYKTDSEIIPYVYYDKNLAIYINLFDTSKQTFDLMRLPNMISYLEKTMKSYIENKDYYSLFVQMEKAIRIDYLNLYSEQILDDQFLKVFEFVYSSSEYGFDKINESIFKRVKKLSQTLETEKLTIYRGECSKSNHYTKSKSWTLSYDIAKFFANRFGKGKIYQGEVDKKDIIYFIKNEDEVLVDSKYIKNIKEM